MTLDKKNQLKLAAILQKARKQADISQARMGELAGISSQYVSNCERGACVTNFIILRAYKAALPRDHRKWFNEQVLAIHTDSILEQLK